MMKSRSRLLESVELVEFIASVYHPSVSKAKSVQACAELWSAIKVKIEKN